MGMNNFAGNGGNGQSSNGGIGIQMPQASQSDPTEFLINYNQKYAQSDPAMFRDGIVEQTMGVLLGKDKPNALLVGPAGVGKTKIAEEIARRIVTHNPTVPDKLQDSVIYELPLSNLVAGSGIVGDLEQKVKDVIGFAEDPDNHAILFIDEIHQLADSHTPTYSKIAQILKPALSRGELKVIGATTTQESRALRDDPALNRRFSRIIVDELTQEQTVEILRAARASYIMHYGKVTIDDAILPEIVTIADRYAGAGNHRPDTALTLLDRACGDAIVARKIKEDKLKDDPAMLAALQANPTVPVTEGQLRTTAMRIMTGHSKRTSLDESVLRSKLAKIKGQDDVVDSIVKQLMRQNRGLFPRTTPLTFLFAGPSGVGKTEVTKIIAEVLTETKPITLSMPEYHSSASINRIIGSPLGYVGSESATELPFDCLESNPYQVILLDEFEKADRSVQRLFMSAFDEGCIKTARGTTVDFSKSIIIATTNASHTTGASRHIGFTETKPVAAANKATIDDLSQWFDVELLNRFTKVYTFHELSRDTFAEIVRDDYRREIARIKAEHRSVHAPDEIPDADLERIVEESYIPAMGARPAGRAVEDYIQETV